MLPTERLSQRNHELYWLNENFCTIDETMTAKKGAPAAYQEYCVAYLSSRSHERLCVQVTEVCTVSFIKY